VCGTSYGTWFVRISGSISTFEDGFEIQGTGAPFES
jgi:hypothetical protein